ncbi:MAG: undecaprenyldiphospho-muramoylpentapeptide beta-N-acetylglucosaminyltransferase [Actinomycetia bacterium]|nr:undecaprenyldiphospho-muramoylpentapeptide beta-N-acetylglucosaminyltransferase [Actinomycetes bacterium]
MRVVVSAGGTAGHVNPALAVAQELRGLGCSVLWVGTPNSFEQSLVDREGFEFVGFAAHGFNRRRPWTLLSAASRQLAARSACRRWLRDRGVQAVACFGGYATLAVGMAAIALKLPLLVHEQNARIGLANRLLAKNADVLAISYAQAAADSRCRGRVELTGNPLRASLFSQDKAQSRAHFGFDPEALVLLAFGGSLGAKHLNHALLGLAADLLSSFPQLQVLQVTGQLDHRAVQDAALGLGLDERRWRLLPYCDTMGAAYAAADLVLCRAGASTLAELGALAKPSLLVPYPYAAADEQSANAARMAAAGAALVVADAELDSPSFAEKLDALLADGALRQRMAAAARDCAIHHARERVAGIIMELAKDRAT